MQDDAHFFLNRLVLRRLLLLRRRRQRLIQLRRIRRLVETAAPATPHDGVGRQEGRQGSGA